MPPSLNPSPPLSLPSLYRDLAALAALQRRVADADDAVATCALDLGPDAVLPKQIAGLTAQLAAVTASVAQRSAALEAIIRVGTAAKARLAEADTKVSALRAACEALDNDLIIKMAALRGDLAAAIVGAGGAWLETKDT